MKIDPHDTSGLWLLTKRWSFSYWPPKAWKPLSVREGHRGWGGALVRCRLAVDATRRLIPADELPDSDW
jgi:hypothetical protein